MKTRNPASETRATIQTQPTYVNQLKGHWLLKRFTELCRQVTETTAFLKSGMGPEDADHFDHFVEMIVREQARSFDDWCFKSLEPPKLDEMPPSVDSQGQ